MSCSFCFALHWEGSLHVDRAHGAVSDGTADGTSEGEAAVEVEAGLFRGSHDGLSLLLQGIELDAARRRRRVRSGVGSAHLVGWRGWCEGDGWEEWRWFRSERVSVTDGLKKNRELCAMVYPRKGCLNFFELPRKQTGKRVVGPALSQSQARHVHAWLGNHLSSASGTNLRRRTSVLPWSRISTSLVPQHLHLLLNLLRRQRSHLPVAEQIRVAHHPLLARYVGSLSTRAPNTLKMKLCKIHRPVPNITCGRPCLETY